MAEPAPSQAPGNVAPAPATTPALMPIAVDEVPERCLDFAKLAGSTSRNAALSARISLATCMVDQKARPIALCDCEHAVNEVDAVMQPSLVLLDEVFEHGDAAMKVLARHAQGEMLASFAARILATVPQPATNTEEAVALRDTRLAMIRPLVEPWQSRAQASFAEVDKLVSTNPQLEKNAAVAAAARASRAKLTRGVANR